MCNTNIDGTELRYSDARLHIDDYGLAFLSLFGVLVTWLVLRIRII